MNGIGPSFEATSYFNNPWRPFRNTTTETIPAFGVMRVTGVEETVEGFIRYTVAKPNTNFQTHYMINGNHAVPAGEDGRCTTLSQAYRVAYNSSSGTPTIGGEWGAKSGQWTLEKYRPGFIIEGGVKSTGGVDTIIARQFEKTSLLAVNNYELEQGGSAVFVPWFRKTDNSGWEASEYSLTCYDWFMNSSETMEPGYACKIELQGVWTLTAAYCAVSDLDAIMDSLP